MYWNFDPCVAINNPLKVAINCDVNYHYTQLHVAHMTWTFIFTYNMHRTARALPVKRDPKCLLHLFRCWAPHFSFYSFFFMWKPASAGCISVPIQWHHKCNTHLLHVPRMRCCKWNLKKTKADVVKKRLCLRCNLFFFFLFVELQLLQRPIKILHKL